MLLPADQNSLEAVNSFVAKPRKHKLKDCSKSLWVFSHLKMPRASPSPQQTLFIKLYTCLWNYTLLKSASSLLWLEIIPALGLALAVSVSTQCVTQNGKIQKVSHAADCWIQWDLLACHILCYHLTSSSVNSQPGDGDGTEITVLILYGRLHNKANDLCWSV